MPDIDLHRVHGLGLERARGAADEMARDLARRFDLEGHWTGNVLRFERPGIHGELAVDAKALHLTVTLGLLLKAMKSSIEQATLAELDKLFRKAPAARASSKSAERPRKSPATRRPNLRAPRQAGGSK